MAYSQKYQPSEIEKRIGTIRSQLYGKEVINLTSPTGSANNHHLISEHHAAKRDLLKTAVLATVALAIQFALFTGLHLGIIKL